MIIREEELKQLKLLRAALDDSLEGIEVLDKIIDQYNPAYSLKDKFDDMGKVNQTWIRKIESVNHAPFRTRLKWLLMKPITPQF